MLNLVNSELMIKAYAKAVTYESIILYIQVVSSN